MKATKSELRKQLQRMSDAVGVSLALDEHNPGDGVRYRVTDAKGGSNFSPRLKAAEMAAWIDGATWAAEAAQYRPVAR